MNKKIIAILTLITLSLNLSPINAIAADSTTSVIGTSTVNFNNGITKLGASKISSDIINPSINDMDTVLFSAPTMEFIDNEIKLMEATKNIEDVQKIFDDVRLKYETLDTNDVVKIKYNSEKCNDQFNYLLYKCTYLAFYYTQDNIEQRDTFFVKLVDDFYISVAKRFNNGLSIPHFDSIVAYWGYEIDDEFPAISKVNMLRGASMIQQIKEASSFGPNGEVIRIDETIPISQIKFAEMPEPDIKPNVPDESIILQPVPDTSYDPKKDVTTSDLNYGVDNKGNYYKEIVTFDINGNVIKRERSTISEYEYSLFNDYRYKPYGSYTWVTDNDEKQGNGRMIYDVWNSLNKNDLNQLSDNTLQYTLDKTAKEPYYYDSKIRTSTTGAVAYFQLQDCLSQIALKTKGDLIDDSDKLLLVVEGKPLVLVDKKTEYTKEEIDKLFNGFTKTGLKIDKMKFNDLESLETKLNSDDAKKIMIKGNEITLSLNPILKDGQILLPLKEVAITLNLTYAEDGNNAIVTNSDITVKYEVGSKNININGTDKKTKVISILSDNTVFVEMDELISVLNLNIVYDKELGKVEIK